MAVTTPFQYYSDDDSHGDYQFETLKKVIDDLVFESLDDDSYLKNTKRSKMVYHAKEVIRKFAFEGAFTPLAFEITVPENLTVIFPQDYVDWESISVVVEDCVTGSKRLQLLDVNDNINDSLAYLQDNNWEILFDNDGYILTADGENAYAKPYQKYSFCDAGNQPLLDTSKLSEYGEFKADSSRGCFIFSSNLSDKNIVVKYKSDGLQQSNISEASITFLKQFEDAIKAYVYHACIMHRRTVPRGEKMDAKSAWKGQRTMALRNTAPFDFNAISRLMRQKTMTL